MLIGEAKRIFAGQSSIFKAYRDGVQVWPVAVQTMEWVAGTGNYITGGPATCTITFPSVQNNDLAIMVAGIDQGTDLGISTPDGWTFVGKTAATNMYSYVFRKYLTGSETTLGVALPASGTVAVGIWRGVSFGSAGSFGVRSVSSNTVTAPDISGSSNRIHVFSDRTIAANAGEVDVLNSVTYGSHRYTYGGNPTIGSGLGICAVFFVDSTAGQSGSNTATLSDSGANAWGLQIAVN
jgi:hypothetical protein